MDTNAFGATLSPARLLQLAAIAVGATFVWLFLSLAIGASSAQASDEAPSPIGSLGSLVSDVTSPVADLTTPVLQPVADVIAPVAVAVAPVVETVAPVASPLLDPLVPVSDVVTAVTAPLTPIVAPVVDVVRPVTNAVAPVVVPVVAVLTPVVPTLPGIIAVTPPGSTSGGTEGTTGTADALVTASTGTTTPVGVTALFAASGAMAPGHGILEITLASLTATASAVPDLLGALGGGHPFGPSPASTTFFSSGSGSALGASAVLVLGLLAAHRAWVLRRSPGDDSALPAPLLSTDVSPD